jgi:hypothetical protein
MSEFTGMTARAPNGVAAVNAAVQQLLAGGWVLVAHRVFVGRSLVAPLTRRRGDHTPKSQQSEEEESNPVRASAQLRRLGLGLMTVGHQNLASSVPCIPHTPAHIYKS